MKSQCCDNFGFQCYQKNATFAACLKKCEAPKMAAAGNGTWSCTALGVRTRCASTTENCLDYGCCADSQMQCYSKDGKYGQCRISCDQTTMAAVDGGAKWWCAPIGPRNSKDYSGDFVPSYTDVEPWVKNCTPLGENCASTKCCSWTGYKCYEKKFDVGKLFDGLPPKQMERRCGSSSTGSKR